MKIQVVLNGCVAHGRHQSIHILDVLLWRFEHHIAQPVTGTITVQLQPLPATLRSRITHADGTQ